MKRLVATIATLCALLVPLVSQAQVQPVPRWHTDNLYWANARFANIGPAFWLASILHGVGVESDTIMSFSLQDAVDSPAHIYSAVAQGLGTTGTVAASAN